MRTRCAAAGLDLVQSFAVGWYNAAVAEDLRLPDLGRASALGLLIGNTRAYWPRFVAALRESPALLDDPDPIERHAGDAVAAAVAGLGLRCAIRGAAEPPPRRVAMQRLAHVSGLAYLAPGRLNVHPTFGPWIALRAAVVVDADGPGGPPPALPDPCARCASACLPAFEHAARAAAGDGSPGEVARLWRLWLAVRDACPIGREHRYDEAQIAYHYTKDREILRRLAADLR